MAKWGQKFMFNGLDMSENNVVANNFFVRCNKNVRTRSTILNRQNSNGSFVSNVVANGRLFTFTGRIFGPDKISRANAQNRLIQALTIPGVTSDVPDGLILLEWETDDGVAQKTLAKIITMPQFSYTDELGQIDFEFELFSPSAEAQGTVDKSSTGDVGFIGGFGLPCDIPLDLGEGQEGVIIVENNGNYEAPAKITVLGNCVNPTIYNITTGFVGFVEKTTLDLLIDNTGDNFVTTDEGADISGLISDGMDNVTLIKPGINQYVLTANSTDSVVFTIEWNDTYLQS